MGDVVSTHLDESRRDMITDRTRQVMKDFGRIFEQQYSVALFDSMRAEIEGTRGTCAQLLHRKGAPEGKTIFSGSLLHFLDQNRKWKNRYVSIPNSYGVLLYENKTACVQGLEPKVRISCAGYKVLGSLEEYEKLLDHSLPGVKAKAGSSPFLKTVTSYTILLWHPFAQHHCFCVLTEKEHSRWSTVLQDCVRHANYGLPEESTVQTPAFTNSVRLYRQAQGHYGSWNLMCGTPPQILCNLVMEKLQPDLRTEIGPRLRGKLQQRQRSWILISGAVHRQVLSQTMNQFEALLSGCEEQRGPLDAALRTNMDQIIASKEHVCSKIQAMVLPQLEPLLQSSVRPSVSSILEALMEPTSRGFSEVRQVFSTELVELSKTCLNQDEDQDQSQDRLREHLEKVSMLAFHPVKMRSCYEQLDLLDLEEFQEKFNICGASVFSSRAQILLREQMDNAVFTLETLLSQGEKEGELKDAPQGEELEEVEPAERLGEAERGQELCKNIQRCQDRVLKKFDYDSSTVRKKFFREALLQILVPYVLQQLESTFTPELPRFQELIFEDFSGFLPVENLYEEVVVQAVSKDVMSAVKEAAIQRRHNLYRDSIILTNSDPRLHLLDQKDTNKFSTEEPLSSPPLSAHKPSIKGRLSNYSSRRQKVVSMIELEGVSLPYDSLLEVPGEDLIVDEDSVSSVEEDVTSPDSINQIRGLINPVVEVVLPVTDEEEVADQTEFTTGKVVMEGGIQEEVTHVTTKRDTVPRSSVKIRNNNDINASKEVSPTTKTFPKIDQESEKLANMESNGMTHQTEKFLEPKPQTKKSPQSVLQLLMGSKRQEEEAAIKRAIHELDVAVEGEEDSDYSDSDLVQQPWQISGDSGFRSPTIETSESGFQQTSEQFLHGLISRTVHS